MNSGASGPGALGRRLPGAAFWLYKRCLSPAMHAVAPCRCRYLPTCSEYAYAAIDRFGAIRGACLAARRLLRCHPWSAGGLDPVPGGGNAVDDEGFG